MSDDQAFRQCVQAFADRDYAGCANQAMALLSSGASLELLQLLLISMQRLGQMQWVERFGPQALAATAESPWDNALLRITLGQADPGQLLKQARDARQSCQVLYYAGARLLTEGEVGSARQAFIASLFTNDDCLERQLARIDMTSKAPDPPQSSPEVILEQLILLVRKVGDLYEQGNYDQAMVHAKQVCELKRQLVGEDDPEYATSLNILAGIYNAAGNFHEAEQLFRRVLNIRRVALGEDHPDYAQTLNSLAGLLHQTGNNAAAEPFFRQAEEILRAALGDGDPGYASCLHGLATVYYEMGNYAAAEPLFQQAGKIFRTALGEDHLDYAKSLNGLACLYSDKGNYPAAESLHRQALEIRRVALGEGHPLFASSLHNLSTLYFDMGNYAAAEQLCRQDMEIRRTALGEVHAEYAASLHNLATLHSKLGNYAAAEPFHRKAVEIRRSTLGESHPHYLRSLHNLAQLYCAMGNYAAAESRFQQILEARRSSLGENHPDYATSLNDLALLHRTAGKYHESVRLFRRAAEIYGTTLGEDHPDYAASLDNLAGLYFEMDNYAAAESLSVRANEIYRTALGRTHPYYAQSLNSLAVIYASMGNFSAAESLLQEAEKVYGASLGKGHPEYATCLSNLAQLYCTMGCYDTAKPLFQQAIEIQRVALGESHPDYANCLNNLAELCVLMGIFTESELLHRTALEIRRTALGEVHPHYADSLYNLSILCVATGRAVDAFSLLGQAAAIDDRMIGQFFSIGSETQRMAFLVQVWGKLHGVLSLVWQHFGESVEAVRTALDLVLRRKAIGAEALAAQRDAVLSDKYPELAPRLREWSTLRGQIAQKTLAGPGPEGLQAHQQLLAKWNQQKEQVEAELVRQIPEMNLEQKLRSVDRSAVAHGLPGSSILIEFVRFNLFDFQARAERQSETQWKPPQRWKSARYLAFVLCAGEPDGVQMIDLGEAEPIDQLIDQFRTGITGEVDRSMVVKQQPKPSPDAQASAGAALRAAVFDKVIPALGDRTRLLLAPDGDLTRLPFEVLPTEDGRLLVDRYNISYLGCGRDVLRFGAASSGQPTEPLIAAAPDFDFGGGTTPSATPELSQGRWSPHIDQLGSSVKPLPAAEVEGERIAARLGTKPWLGSAVLERRLRDRCRSPLILHLATHGFFLEGPADERDRWLRTSRDLGGLPGGRTGPLPENPLLRSGLVLAGVNTWLKSRQPLGDAEDGLLTAEDVSGMDLLATELVVLSACDTGLGRVHTGEGVFGLQRAFVLAGAKTLVMSLWKVPDAATAILMDRFYENLLRHRMGRAEALRDAQQHVRTLTIGAIRASWLSPATIERLAGGDDEAERYLQDLARQPDDHRPFSDPRDWGAFICQGQPGPLPIPSSG